MSHFSCLGISVFLKVPTGIFRYRPVFHTAEILQYWSAAVCFEAAVNILPCGVRYSSVLVQIVEALQAAVNDTVTDGSGTSTKYQPLN